MTTCHSPVATVPLKTNGQFVVVVGNVFDGGHYIVGPFDTEKAADDWFEDNGGGIVVACLDPHKTLVDRCGYPLHLADAGRS
jgi:hypothetical protein